MSKKLTKLEEKYLLYLEVNPDNYAATEYVAKDLAIRFAVELLGKNGTIGIHHYSKWEEEVDRFIDEKYR